MKRVAALGAALMVVATLAFAYLGVWTGDVRWYNTAGITFVPAVVAAFFVAAWHIEDGPR